MQSRSIAAIRYVDASELYQWMKQGVTSMGEQFQVIDVRGSDYIGGHIAKGWNYPYKQLRDNDDVLQELVDKLKVKGDGVINCVFHCALSQQRGPSAAMRFLRCISDEDLSLFRVWVLRGGFNHWQGVYGSDPSVTEAYRADIWSM